MNTTKRKSTLAQRYMSKLAKLTTPFFDIVNFVPIRRATQKSVGFVGKVKKWIMKKEFVWCEDYPEIWIYNARMYKMPVIWTVVVVGIWILTLLILWYSLVSMWKLIKILVWM